MSEPLYDIYFRGECLDGKNPAQVKQHFMQLFKLPEDKIAVFFSGKVLPLKKNLDKASTIKFKQLLEKAGAKIYIKAAVQAPVNAPEKAASEPVSKPAAASMSADLQALPLGSDVLAANERSHNDAPEIDTSHIRLASHFAELRNLETPPAPPAPDVSYITTAAVGSDVLEGYHEAEIALPVPDISHISIAEAGADLIDLVEDLDEIVVPDTHAITLAELGADMDTGEKTTPPPAPDVSYIKLDNSP